MIKITSVSRTRDTTLSRGLYDEIRFGVVSQHDSLKAGLPLSPGGLNRSMQHFILEGKDGVRNGTKIS